MIDRVPHQMYQRREESFGHGLIYFGAARIDFDSHQSIHGAPQPAH
jgi:hypothetical protein